jgi:hypothetical protein
MPAMKTICSQPSHVIATKNVRAAVTATGGHLAPVTFTLGRRTVQPFSIAPWHGEKLPGKTPAILRVLRGDFFCLPFGGGTLGREQHPTHGETANRIWRLESQTRESLHLSLRTKVRAGRVDKRITLVPGHSVVYQEHTLTGMGGPMCLGHHATLKFNSPGRLSTSRRAFGQVAPEPVEQPAAQGYSILQPGAVFADLAAVPMVTGANTDLSRYPNRRGFEDIAILCADPQLPLAWTAVAFPAEGYAWFSLRDPRVLASTLLWMSNGGRYYAPWNGRHVDVMGIEDLTAFFHYGIGPSVTPNALAARGIRTHHVLDAGKPFMVRYIMGVAAVPKGFARVADLVAATDSVTLVSETGQEVTTPVNVGFLDGAGRSC